jgi:hypothetical protein
MRLILDEGLPQLIENFRLADLEFVRWHSEALDDLGLLRRAKAEGFTAVVFLGLNVVESFGFPKQSQLIGIKVFATYETDPMKAAIDIGKQLEAIRRAAAQTGIHIIYSREVRKLGEK